MCAISGHTSDEATTCSPREASNDVSFDEKKAIYHHMDEPTGDVRGESAKTPILRAVSDGPNAHLRNEDKCTQEDHENVIERTKGESYGHISEMQTPCEQMDVKPSFESMLGPPTFGVSGRSSNHGASDVEFQSRAFNGLSNNYVVLRNIGIDSQNATFSFGYDEPQHHMGMLNNIIETVNYYKPDHSPQQRNEYSVSQTNGSGGTAYNSVVSNMGGDTTTSMNSRCSENDYSRDTFDRLGVMGCDSPIASSTGGRRMYPRLGRVTRQTNRRTSYTGHSSAYSDAESHADGPSPVKYDGLFEVPLNVCSMSRIIDPFKGFSKVHTNRAIRLLHFIRKGNRTVCNLESNACKLIQNRIKDYKVVVISVCGDNRSGKSYLASLLVNQPVKSFRCSEPYSASEAFNHPQGPAEGTIWAYVGIYEDKLAYIILDLDGFENHQQQRISMSTFALLLSNCVICNIANVPRTGIYDTVKAMIEVSKTGESMRDGDAHPVDMDETIEEFRKKTSFFLNKQVSLTKSLDAMDNALLTDSDSDDKSQVEDSDLWVAPIIHFVFRDCDGHVRCMDDRIYTPETLVEQGIFDHYTNIFNCHRRDRTIDFKNDMLDAFEVFPNRKYTTLQCPVGAPAALSMFQRTAASNAKDTLKRIFATLLAPANAHIMSTDTCDTSAGRFLGTLAMENQPNLMAIPNNLLNPQFCERLDEVKSCVYQDTLAHAQTDSQLNGRMFITYMKLLIARFNTHGRIDAKDAASMLREVHIKENDSIGKDVTLQFLKGLKHHVVMHLPMEPRELLSKCMRLKQKCLQAFQMRVSGTMVQFREQFDTLEKSLDSLIERLEGKNDSIAVDTATALFDKCARSLDEKMVDESYTYEELLVDIAKMRKMFLQKFKGHSQVTEKVFPQLSQQLYRTFDEYHPKSPAPNVAEISKRYA